MKDNLTLRRFINLLVFEIKFNILAILLLAPLLNILSEIMASFLGFNYISFDIIQNNIGNFRIWSIILIEFILFTFLALIEIAGSIIIYYKNPYKVCLFKDVIKGALKLVKESLKSPLIIPITGGVVLFTFFQTTVSSRLRMPAFIKNYIVHDNILYILYYTIIFIIFCIIIRLIFIYNEIFLNKTKLSIAIKRSFEQTKTKFIKLFIVISVINFLTQFFGYLTTLLIDSLISELSYIQGSTYKSIFGLSILRIMIIISRFLRLAITVSIIRGTIYYFYEKQTDKIAINCCIDKLYIKSFTKFRNYKLYLLICISLIINAIYFNFLISKEVNISNSIDVTAHRGGGNYEVENTLHAIKEGARRKAKYAEIDVRLTKDYNLVLSHDKSLSRIFNINKNVGDLTLDEIKKISLKKDDNIYNIPTLGEAIQEAKKVGIILNIEIKANSILEYKSTAKKVFEVVKQYKYEDVCVVSSLSLLALNDIKTLDAKIKTSLIVIANVSNISKIRGIDFVAVEEGYITRKLVEECHERGIGVQAWTPNDKGKIFKIIEVGVDNIITDEPDIAINEINKFESLPLFGNRIVRLLLDG